MIVQVTVVDDEGRPRSHLWWEVRDDPERLVDHGLGEVADPDVSVRVREQDWGQIRSQRLGVVEVFRQGRLQVVGDLGRVMAAADLLEEAGGAGNA